MSSAIYFVVHALTQIVLMLFLLRLWLPLVRADFRNPIAQGIMRLTAPVIIPVRRFVPSIGRLDTAVVLVAYAIQFATSLALLMVLNVQVSPAIVAVSSLVHVCLQSINLFFFAIVIQIILGWVAPMTQNPVAAIAGSMAEPILRPFRRLIPPFGGIDISPILAIIALKAVEIYVRSLSPLLF